MVADIKSLFKKPAFYFKVIEAVLALLGTILLIICKPSTAPFGDGRASKDSSISIHIRGYDSDKEQSTIVASAGPRSYVQKDWPQTSPDRLCVIAVIGSLIITLIFIVVYICEEETHWAEIFHMFIYGVLNIVAAILFIIFVAQTEGYVILFLVLCAASLACGVLMIVDFVREVMKK